MSFGKRMMSLTRRLGLLVSLTLFVLLVAAPCSAQRGMVVGQDDSMPASAEFRAAAVDSVSWALNKTYVFEDVAKEMEKHIRRKLKKGEYDDLETVQEFARQLTEDMREISSDRHLGVQFMSDEEAFTLDWAIAGLEAELHPVEVDVATLESYAGDYGPRHLRVKDGHLLYNRDERDPIAATPMTETMFSFDTVPYFRLEIVLGDDGVPVKLIGHYDNGRTDENPRDQ